VTTKAKAVGYVRVSRVGSRGGDSFLSPDLQREQIAAAARREGLDVVEVLEELDASGGDASREKWNEAIARVERGDVSAVVVWNLSRFSRSVRDALNALGRIEDAGGRLVSATEQFGDDPTGRMTRNILLAIARASASGRRPGSAPPRRAPSSAASTSRARSPTATSGARTGGSCPTPTRPRSCSASSSGGPRACPG
jgi:hypothetical protein